MGEDVIMGWKTEEYVGVSILNLWSLVSVEERSKYRNRNKWFRWLCLEYVPDSAPIGGGIVFRLRWFNSINRIKRYINFVKCTKRSSHFEHQCSVQCIHGGVWQVQPSQSGGHFMSIPLFNILCDCEDAKDE